LTCHFFLLAQDVSCLALGVIELGCKACLVLPVSFTTLLQPRLMTMFLAAVALTVIAGAADVKDDAASWTSTHSLAYLDWLGWIDWQGGRAFPKAGLDNGHQLWQAMDRSIGWSP
jgi:hypothetical protein